jgi:hypothetical protein
VRLVLDLLFIETIDFTLTIPEGNRCQATGRTMEDSFRYALELKGIELMDYGSVQFVRTPTGYSVQGRSKAWRERTERQTVPR